MCARRNLWPRTSRECSRTRGWWSRWTACRLRSVASRSRARAVCCSAPRASSARRRPEARSACSSSSGGASGWWRRRRRPCGASRRLRPTRSRPLSQWARPTRGRDAAESALRAAARQGRRGGGGGRAGWSISSSCGASRRPRARWRFGTRSSRLSFGPSAGWRSRSSASAPSGAARAELLRGAIERQVDVGRGRRARGGGAGTRRGRRGRVPRPGSPRSSRRTRSWASARPPSCARARRRRPGCRNGCARHPRR